MINITLPVWLQKGSVVALKNAAQQWWADLLSYTAWPAKQKDVEQCHDVALAPLGWERNLVRYSEESIEQYRARVRHAFTNAVDAGSTAGFKRIIARLGVGVVDIKERMPGEDWDVVAVVVTNEQEQEFGQLMRVIIRDYGRTCRRYRLHTDYVAPVSVQSADISHNVMVLEASI